MFVSGGDVYIYRLTDVEAVTPEPWNNDGYLWKSLGTQHLPNSRKCQVVKQSYCLCKKVHFEMNINMKWGEIFF